MSQSIKKKLAVLMAVAVMAVPMGAYAQDKPVVISEKENVVISEKEEMKNEYINYAGKISEVIEDDKNMSIHVKSDDKEDLYGMTFHIGDHVSVWDRGTENLVEAKNLKEGMLVQVSFHKLTPTTMSIPAQLTPAVVLIQKVGSEKAAYLGEFDDQLLNSENDLQLNLGPDTLIVNQKGEALTAKEIQGKTLLVFHEIVTLSIPAQTTPNKIVLIGEKEEPAPEEEEDKVEDLDQAKEMIALRDTASELAYKVEWNNDDKTVELTKENQTIVLKLNEVDYSLNKSLGRFTKAPELRNGSLYVSASVLDFMN